jgi:hypothetical protein
MWHLSLPPSSHPIRMRAAEQLIAFAVHGL